MRLDDVRFDYEVNTDLVYWLVDIDHDRYGGCYSGARYTAWPGPRPDDIDAGDFTCEEFWQKHRGTLHGRGDTPQAAYKDLLSKVMWDAACVQVVAVAGQFKLVQDGCFDAWLAQ